MKKQEERLYLDAFSELRSDLQLTEIIESERPDFLCNSCGAPVGIEMTRFFLPSGGSVSPQALNGYRNQLARALRDEHAKRNIPPFHVSVHFFAEEKLLDRDTRQRLTNYLLEFAAQRMPAVGPHVVFEYEKLTSELTELGVQRISILRNASLTQPFWSLPYASFVPDSDSSQIQAVINEKSPLVAEYRRKAAVIWLLIVSGSGGLHSIIDFDGDVLSASYAANFDRVFLFRTFGSSVHELKKA